MHDLNSLKRRLAELESELKRVSVIVEGGKIQINGTFR